MVELLPSKQVVAGSIPVSRSTPHQTSQRMQGEGRRRAVFCFSGRCTTAGWHSISLAGAYTSPSSASAISTCLGMPMRRYMAMASVRSSRAGTALPLILRSATRHSLASIRHRTRPLAGPPPCRCRPVGREGEDALLGYQYLSRLCGGRLLKPTRPVK